MNAITEPGNFMSWITQMLGSVPSTILWLFAGFVVLAISSIFFQNLRRVLYRLMQAAIVVLFLCVALSGTYLLLFDRCRNLVNYDDGRDVRLLGVCREVQVSPAGEGRRASFVVRTPTGKMKVVTTSGAPAEGTVIYIRGRKGTYGIGRVFVESDYQLSAF
jgi:hypothetical protein